MKTLLKFITCGSVDDGKSTLIGHMLYDAKLIFADQKRALELDSRLGSSDGTIDYSLLLDGLMSEREQGITIDVAYRYFTTSNRSFIVADCPGHEQYTRNMAVGASFAEAAVILVNASAGVVQQTKRHARICALMGIKNIILAVNKMDLVGYDKHIFDGIIEDFKMLCEQLDVDNMQAIPVSATVGDNVTVKSSNTPWYAGETLLDYLENLDVDQEKSESGFVMPVQRVCRPNHQFRGFQGEIELGQISIGDKIKALPGDEEASITRILVGDKDCDKAVAGQPVTLCTDREIDISRGSILSHGIELVQNNLISAKILWMDDKKLVLGRSYYIKCGTRVLPASIIKVKYKVDINDGKHINTEVIYKNEIAEVDVSISDKMIFDSFENNQALGRFILIDRVSHMTSACGIIEYGLRRGSNVIWHETSVSREVRADQKSQKPMTVWFTGLSGSGKSTIANALESRLVAMNKHTMLLDGDNIRHGLNSNLGFTEQDRVENIRRVAEVAKLMNDAGIIAITAFISPYMEDRESSKRIIGQDSFIDVYLSTSLEECERRDVKGLYKKARNNEIVNFTGISSSYEAPENPALTIDTAVVDVNDAVDMIIDYLYN